MSSNSKTPILFVVIVLVVVGAALDRHVRGAMAKQPGGTAVAGSSGLGGDLSSELKRESAASDGLDVDLKNPSENIVDEAPDEIKKEREGRALNPDVETYEQVPAPSEEGA